MDVFLIDDDEAMGWWAMASSQVSYDESGS
jgi:hypothetical protein